MLAGCLACKTPCDLLSLAPETQIPAVEEHLVVAASPQSTSNIEVLPPAPITSDSILGICSGRSAFLSTDLGYLHTVLLSSSPLHFKQQDPPTKGMMSQIHLHVQGDAVTTDLRQLPDAQSCELGGCLRFRSEQYCQCLTREGLWSGELSGSRLRT